MILLIDAEMLMTREEEDDAGCLHTARRTRCFMPGGDLRCR